MRIDRISTGLLRAGLLVTAWLSGCSAAPEPSHGSRSDAGESELREDESAHGPSESAPDIHAAAHDEHIHSPADATPSPDGSRIYYVALGRDDSGEDSAGVFSVAAVGGESPQTLASGPPLAYPINIATSLDGAQLFVADRAAGDEARGALLTLGASDGAIQVLEGTQDYRPGGLTVQKQDGGEQVLFTGLDPQRGVAGVFAIAPSGGAVRTLASGDLFHEPSGVAAAADGTLYVVDITDGAAQVLRVQRGNVETIVAALGVGFPAGIALTHDDKTLLVSGIDPSTHHDVVHVLDLASGKLSQWTQGVSAFAEAAGLHRAHDRDVFAWADSQADRTGTVYVLEP